MKNLIKKIFKEEFESDCIKLKSLDDYQKMISDFAKSLEKMTMVPIPSYETENGIIDIPIDELKSSKMITVCAELPGFDDFSDEYERNKLINALKSWVETEFINNEVKINDYVYGIKKGDIRNDKYFCFSLSV